MTDNREETAVSEQDVQAIKQLGAARDRIVTETRKVIVGMDQVIDEMMIAIFSRGHCLLIGAPGLAKTLPWDPPAAAGAGNMPGCAYGPRCPAADETCRARAPALEYAGGGHRVACHHWRK